MGVVKLSTAGILDYQKYSSALAGNTPYSPIPPSSYDLLETEILTGSQSSVTFSSLNSTYGADYQHLQVRMTGRRSDATDSDNLYLQFNSVTGASYTVHYLFGNNGSGVISGGGANQTYIIAGRMTGSGSTANAFGASVIDILDPFETTKNTTMRSLSGSIGASNSTVWLFSGAFINTSAVDSIKLYPGVDFVTGSRFSLYGLRKAA